MSTFFRVKDFPSRRHASPGASLARGETKTVSPIGDGSPSHDQIIEELETGRPRSRLRQTATRVRRVEMLDDPSSRRSATLSSASSGAATRSMPIRSEETDGPFAEFSAPATKLPTLLVFCCVLLTVRWRTVTRFSAFRQRPVAGVDHALVIAPERPLTPASDLELDVDDHRPVAYP